MTCLITLRKMARSKSTTDVKIEQLCREVKELRTEVQSLTKTVSFGKGAVWVLILLGSIVGGAYNYIIGK
jgi:hypothetical protein